MENKEIEKHIKNGDFTDFRDKNELCRWLLCTNRIKTSSECNSWISRYLPKEKVYQKKILDYIKKIDGAFVWKEQSGRYQRGGIPDVIAVINGKIYCFEVKRPLVGIVSELQRDSVNRIRKAGGTAEIVSYVDEVKNILGGFINEQS